MGQTTTNSFGYDTSTCGMKMFITSNTWMRSWRHALRRTGNGWGTTACTCSNRSPVPLKRREKKMAKPARGGI
eukprot:6120201-Prorocentrum_lima.AAC.1